VGWGGVTIEQRFSQFTVTGGQGRGMVMVPWSCLCWPAGRPPAAAAAAAGHRFPITGSAVNLGLRSADNLEMVTGFDRNCVAKPEAGVGGGRAWSSHREHFLGSRCS